MFAFSFSSELEKVAREATKKTFTIEAPPDVMRRFERFLCFLHYNGGHSGLFAMSFDGDGADFMKVDPPPPRELKEGMRDVSGADVEIARDDSFGKKWCKR